MAGNVKIHVSNLVKRFGDLEVLKDISMDVTEGEVVVLLGPSGSGKSTFLRCLNRLETPSGGQILIDGHDVTDKRADLNEVREKVGVVFQFPLQSLQPPDCHAEPDTGSRGDKKGHP